MARTARGIKIEPGRKRVRTYLAGQLVADTIHPVLVWEGPHYPVYYLPAADIRAELVPVGRTEHSPSRGDAQVFDVKTASATAPAAALQYPESPLAELRDLVRLDWSSMSEWFEEDEPVYTHPRDPYTRVDILASSRHVRVELDGITVAESRRPRILYETGLPPRYYLPLTDVRMDLLRPSDSETHLPVQGHRKLLVRGHRAGRAPRHRVDVPFPTAGEPEDRRAGLLLHREGRPLRGRGAAIAPAQPFS
jgi:uncharacterized protein (DUF427 family)